MAKLRFWITATALIILSGCGFEPLHKKNSLVDDRVASILILPIADRDGQILHNMLRDRLNPNGMPPNPAYLLAVTLTKSIESVGGSSATNTASRALIHKAEYELQDARNGRVIFDSKADSRIYYANYNNFYDGRPSEENAALNGLRVLSGEIHKDLASLFVLDTVK